ncbi:MAG: hypothetical protein CMO66_06135 [Verrucomicrobiales bacterium]|nr:hypothetical protein [Verrucomicrobiales bacterium]
MRPLWHTLGYLLMVFPGGALLAPFAWMAVHGNPAPLSFLNEHDDFHRFITRMVMILALGGLWPLLRMNKMASIKQVGLSFTRNDQSRLLTGFATGIGCILLVSIIAHLATPNISNFGHSSSDWIRHFKNASLAMLLVPLIEEILFRGVLFGGLRLSLNWQWAAVLSSIIFASVHFLNSRPENPDPVHVASGLILLPSMMHGPAGDPHWVPRFLNLFIAGLILCGLYRKTGNLYASMAIHAGWILGGKTFGFITSQDKFTLLHNTLWGPKELIQGWAVTPILMGMFAWIWFMQQDVAQPSDFSHDPVIEQ